MYLIQGRFLLTSLDLPCRVLARKVETQMTNRFFVSFVLRFRFFLDRSWGTSGRRLD